MEVSRVLRMNGGSEETSYANNSSLQKAAILKAKCMVEDTILDLYCRKFSKSLSIADLGCASGPNTLLVVTEIIEAINEKCRELKRRSPDLLVFLNDLPGNDFNTIFKSLPSFYQTLKDNKGLDFEHCFIAGVPGSFYQRLFPANFIDFFHSSYSLHWLSQGIIEGAKVNSFDMPYYPPSAEELKTVIDMEGSFNLDRLEIVEINDDNDDDKFTCGKNIASCVRALTESMLASHFGEAMMDILFKRYAENAVEYLAKEKTKNVNLIFSLTKRG